MRKILIFSTNYLPNIGGAELAIKEIADRLDDVEFHLITARLRRSLPKIESLGRVRVYRMGFGTGFDKLLLPILGTRKAVSLHRALHFDAAWSMMASQASVAASFFKLRRRRVPLVLTLQEGDEEEHLKRYAAGIGFLYKLLIRPWHLLVFKLADRVTVISGHLEARARRNNRAVPIVLVPNGVDIKAFEKAAEPSARLAARRRFGFSDHDTVVATVGRLVAKNRTDTLIRAIALLPPSYKLLIAGTGALEGELRRLAQELSVTSRVVFAGRVEPDQVPEYLAAADVFSRPSASEGLGTAFLEAMAASVPVVATRVGGITDFLEDKKTGLFAGVGDAEDVARKITILARDRILRADIIEAAHELVSERYNWEAVALSMKTHAFEPLFLLRRQRLLVSTGIYPPAVGGPATYAKYLNDALWDMGVASTAATYGWEANLPIGLRHVCYFLRVLVPVLRSDWVLALDTFSVGVPTVWAARLLRRKVVVRVGGDYVWERYVERTHEDVPLPEFYRENPQLSFKERIVRFLSRAALKRADAVVFSTEWQRALWTEPYRLRREKTAVIENCYGKREPTDAPERKVFLWAGRPIFLKNTERMKEAFEKARKRDEVLSLECLSVPHEVLLSRIRSSYAVILPSLSEVSPNFILEAIRFEKPFVTTRHIGLKDRIGKLGVFVDPTDEKAITEGIMSLADPEVYRTFRGELRQFGFTHTWTDIAAEFISIFESL